MKIIFLLLTLYVVVVIAGSFVLGRFCRYGMYGRATSEPCPICGAEMEKTTFGYECPECGSMWIKC